MFRVFGFAWRRASILHCSRIFWAQGSPAWSIFQCSLGNASWQWCSSWRLQIKCSGLFEFILKHWRILRAFWLYLLYFTWHILFGIGVQHATSFNYTMKLAACWFLSNVHRTYIVSFYFMVSWDWGFTSSFPFFPLFSIGMQCCVKDCRSIMNYESVIIADSVSGPFLLVKDTSPLKLLERLR